MITHTLHVVQDLYWDGTFYYLDGKYYNCSSQDGLDLLGRDLAGQPVIVYDVGGFGDLVDNPDFDPYSWVPSA